jgi:hypothetical protein
VTDTLPLLEEFYADKLAMLARHQAATRVVRAYYVNNMYQYVINREEVQLSWVAKAITEMGGAVPDSPANTDAATQSGPARAVLEQDEAGARSFVERWQPRIDAMTNARHRGMLRVILGETLEQRRFFEQAIAGRTDLLGRRNPQLPPAVGEVLPTRWIE